MRTYSPFLVIMVNLLVLAMLATAGCTAGWSGAEEITFSQARDFDGKKIILEGVLGESAGLLGQFIGTSEYDPPNMFFFTKDGSGSGEPIILAFRDTPANDQGARIRVYGVLEVTDLGTMFLYVNKVEQALHSRIPPSASP